MPLFNTATAVAESFVLPAPATPAGLGDDAVLLASQALTTESPVVIEGMARPFLAHQGAAYLYALDSIARWGCAVLGDDMGLGKTQVMEALIASLRNGGYAILVAPPVALGTHERELAVAFPGLKLAHLKGRKRYHDEDGNEVLPVADIYFLSDDSQTLACWLTDGRDDKGKDIPSALALGAAVYCRDEIHRDKGQGVKPTGRARIALMMGRTMRAKGAPVVIATGTLLTNRPVEAYIPLQVAGGDDLVMAVSPGARTKSHFLYRYCKPTEVYVAGGRKVVKFEGCDKATLAELHELLRRTVYVRREKEDLGDVLPHGGWIVTPLALNGTMARYRRIEKDFFNLLLEEKGPDAAWKASKAETITKMQALWAEAGVAKAVAAAEYVGDLVEEGKSVVVFFNHREVRDALATALGRNKAVRLTLIDGTVTGDERTEAEDDFQAGRCNVMLANITAAGMAVTLTAASEAVFVQVPWSAGALAQAAGRIKRADDISMERAKRGEQVTYHVIQAAYENGDSTFDMAMWAILESKAEVCDAVNAGREITMPEESVVKQALDMWFASASAIHGRKARP